LPLLARRGGRDIKKTSRSIRGKERTGWWFKSNNFFSILSHHPVSGYKVADASFS